jgi:hypothetical protein
MTKPTINYLEILKTLGGHKVDFIVVGGVCSVLHGAPLATFDLDVVHSRDNGNVTRLWMAFRPLAAHYRIRARQTQMPGLSDLASTGHHLLMTRFGPLDLLGAIGKGRDYDQLLNESVEMEVGSGLIVRVATLECLIKTKEESGLGIDQATLPVLRRVLEERAKA